MNKILLIVGIVLGVVTAWLNFNSCTIDLFGANGNTGQERYIILNGVPITFTTSNTNLSPLEAIDEVYKFKIQEHTSVQAAADSKKWGNEAEPIVIINDEWSGKL